MYRPAGVFAEDYVRDMRLLQTPLQRVAVIVCGTAVAAIPLVLSSSWTRFATVTMITVIAVAGLHLLTGMSGQVSVGQAAFMGVGAYAGAALAQVSGLPFLLLLVFAGLSSAIVGLLFGLPAVRTKGFYLALTTIAAQFVFVFAVPRLPEGIFGGNVGLRVSRPSLFGVSLSSGNAFFYATLAVGLVLLLAALFIQQSKIGRALVAIRDDEHAAEVTGINVRYYKVLAFSIASFYAGVAGALLAYEGLYTHFDQFTLFRSIWFLGMLIVGGVGSLLGATLGVVFLRLLEEVVVIYGPRLAELLPLDSRTFIFPLINVVFGGVILTFLIYQPRGINDLYRKVERRIRLWPFPY